MIFLSLTSCVSKLFVRIILSRRLLCGVEFHSLPAKPVSRSGRFTLDQILIFFNPFRIGLTNSSRARTTLATIDFFKALDFVWHPALYHELTLTVLPLCSVLWTRFFFSDRLARVVFQIYQSKSFRVCRGVPQGSVLGSVSFSLHQ